MNCARGIPNNVALQVLNFTQIALVALPPDTPVRRCVNQIHADADALSRAQDAAPQPDVTCI
jgi:hypothetical protein